MAHNGNLGPLTVTANWPNDKYAFVKVLLLKNPLANIIVAGDFNEFLQRRLVYKILVSLLTSIDEVAQIPAVERYSFVFDQNSQQLDHAFVSPAIRFRGVKFTAATAWRPLPPQH